MKRKIVGRAISILLAAMMCLMNFSVFTADAATVLTENKTGEEDGYAYELWKDSGNTSMTLTGGGTFSCEWSNINNCLFRKGKKYDCTQTYQELGNIYIDYGVDYQPNGNSYMCVYGWTRNPLVEYYIVETWGSWRPPGATSSLGQITVDGGTYDIYKTVRENQPSIDGNTTFDQYWSVRTSKPAANGTKIEGTISVSEHFKAWEKVGLKMGKMYEVALNIEGYQSSGKATVYKNDLFVGGETRPDEPVTPVEPDENGYYFHDTFESSVGNWSARGDATTALSSSSAASGSKSLSVTGRTDSWNGAAYALDTAAFVPGNSYSFSVLAMQNSAASDNFKLSLQYDLDGETNYATVAEGTGAKGKWVQLANTSYTIPAGASNLLLYVETEDSTNSFYMDEAIGAVGGTKINASLPGSDDSVTGDADGNGVFEIKDLVVLQKYLCGLRVTIDLKASDADGNGRVNIFDLAVLKNMICKNPGGSDNPSVTDPNEYMASVRASMTADVPSSATASGTFGTLQAIEYYSTTAQRTKKANVLLPEGYSANEKYPVLYVNHGIFGDQNSMLSMGVPEIAGNLARTGEAEKMIIVFPQMYSGTDCEIPSGITQEVEANYDKFLVDLTKDLMPYIEKNYSVKTGRENTAIAGFSMGGRETLYIGISRPDIFGYIGAACPAPGVTPGTDYAGYHPGSLTEDQLKISNKAYEPYILMITGGTNDTVVGTFPQSYHDILTKNGQDHIWQEIQGGGHDNSCVVPMMYNFIRNVFKAGKSGSTTPTTPSTDGYFKSTFESGNDGWTSRGGTTLTSDTANYYSGSKSVKVSGRSDAWQGIAYELDSRTFVPGNSYSFSAAVMQESSSAQEMHLTLQYTDQAGETAYSMIASETAESCKWTKLENTSYKIPAGATDLLLYVETVDSTTDFYVDEAVGAAAGTKSAVVTGGGKVTAAPASDPVPGGVDISWIDTSKPMVAICFDDGAVGTKSTDYSIRIQDAIANSGFHATFFYVGDWINASNQGEINRAYDLGMEIANHSTSHPDLTKLSASEIRKEYDDTSNKIKSIIGQGTSPVMRPPYLSVNDTVKSALSDVALVNCSIDTGDWNGATKDDIINKITTAMNNGTLDNAIVLCHET
ncbi:MAG: glycoside hydrolase family 11 protein, partial [Ruminococcus sp.]